MKLSHFAVVALACLVCLPKSAAAQEVVRVKSQEASVHLDASTYSPTLLTVTAGTLLEVRSRQGDWVAVLLPPNAQGLRKAGFILSNTVEVDTREQPVATPRPPAASAPSSAEWQARYSLAQARRSSGRIMQFSSVGIMAAGVLMSVYGSQDVCDVGSVIVQGRIVTTSECHKRSQPMKWAGITAQGVGAGLFGIGAHRASSAKKEIQALESERGTLGASISLPMPLGQAEARIGRTTELRWQIAW